MNLASKSIFRVINKYNEQWVGSGFVYLVEGEATQPVYVTCAHVIGDALGDRNLAYSETPPKGDFYIDFPNSGHSSLIKARVYQNDRSAWHPLEKMPNLIKAVQDLALITIDKAQLPRGIKPTTIDPKTISVSGDTVYAIGGATANSSYKTNFLQLAEGVAQEPIGKLLQVRARDPVDNAFVESGFSGGPMWSENTGKVLGVVSIADKKKRLAWIIPSASLCEMLETDAAEVHDGEGMSIIDPAPEIPFDFQPIQRELLLRRKPLEEAVDDKVDTAFLIYLHGRPNTGKSSEVQRLMESPTARLVKERTIWQTCIKGTDFSEMADYIAEDCLGITEGKKFGVRELIRSLRGKEMYLVLDGYSPSDHPTLTPLIESAASLKRPTHVVVTSFDGPESTDIEQCAVEVPSVGREEIIASIEAMGAELTIEHAHLIKDENYDASAAYRIVNQIRKGEGNSASGSDSHNRVTQLLDNQWNDIEKKLVACISLAEGNVQEPLYLEICGILSVKNPDNFKQHLLAESLIRADDPRSFSIRDFCRDTTIKKATESLINECHQILGEAYLALIDGKRFDGYSTPSADILNSFRAISHFQTSDTRTNIRSRLLGEIKRSAARKGMHRQLSAVIKFEIDKGNNSDPWNFIQLIQSELALGRVLESFDAAKLAQSEIFSAKTIDLNLIVSLCTQIASVLIQVNQSALAGHLLRVSIKLFPSGQINFGLIPIRDSLMAWCDGKQGRIGAARKVGAKLLAQGQNGEGEPRYLQIGVESTRLGILEATSGNLERADKLLLAGVDNFSRCDRRGEIWALSHLCYLRIQASPTAIPVDLLERLIDLQSTTLLISEETFSHYRLFMQALQGHYLYGKIVSINERFKPLYEKSALSSYEIEYAEAFVEFLKKEFGGRAAGKRMQISHSSNFLSQARMNSAAITRTSYIGEIVKRDPAAVIASLYNEVPIKVILSSAFYSRIMTAGLLKLNDQEYINAFAVSFFDHILIGPPQSRLNYAGFFERCGKTDLAIKLLGSLREDSTFRFHNISANCYRETDFEKSLFHNEQALMKAQSPEEESRIYNNIAALYLIHGKIEELSSAKENIIFSLETRASHFYWPFRTKLAIDILESSDDQVEAKIVQFSRDQKLSERAIQYISGLIFDPKLKMMFLDIAPRHIS